MIFEMPIMPIKSIIGGRKITKHETTREILGKILTDKVAIKYNFCGTMRKNRKYPFKILHIWDLIFNEVVDVSYKSNEADDTCKIWLKQEKKEWIQLHLVQRKWKILLIHTIILKIRKKKMKMTLMLTTRK
ncbi:uncharacterized protein LOC116417314 [Nasonia vitripennis]|uniref:Uncharacterized protein n=1 Tax=Nasonia vitripennis TaxID=7425 RepID=A0A7M7QFH9_NASVI|nr:uncharacterized protein LOC116417314 [Nasonia vitripennis]